MNKSYFVFYRTLDSLTDQEKEFASIEEAENFIKSMEGLLIYSYILEAE